MVVEKEWQQFWSRSNSSNSSSSSSSSKTSTVDTMSVFDSTVMYKNQSQCTKTLFTAIYCNLMEIVRVYYHCIIIWRKL